MSDLCKQLGLHCTGDEETDWARIQQAIDSLKEDKLFVDWLERVGFSTTPGIPGDGKMGVHRHGTPGEYRWTAHYIDSGLPSCRHAMRLAIRGRA